MQTIDSAAIIKRFGMIPHKEGGFYAETDCGERPASSHIYYLLPKGAISAWHRIPNRELWLWHGGGTVTLTFGGSGTQPEPKEKYALNQDNPCITVPPGIWQTALAETADTLVSCVCIPGYCDEQNEIYHPVEEN